MKVSTVVLISALALALNVSTTYADERTPEQVKAAREFTVEGVGFNATPQTIRAKWPTATSVPKQSNPQIGLECIRVEGTANTDGIDFFFLDGKLMNMLVWYFPSRTSKMGSWSTIAEKVVARLGKADVDSKGLDQDSKSKEICEYDWVIEDAERWVRLHVTTEFSVLKVWDREVARKKLAKEKATAETGF